MPDYQKAKIYKLYSVSNEELVYYGSTTQRLSQRLGEHNKNFKNNLKVKSNLVIEAGDYKIELIENYPCNNKQELLKKESEYIRNNVCVNKSIPDRTLKEWIEDNKEKLAEKRKEYYENNKEKINEKNRVYYEDNKEKIVERMKEYYENNKAVSYTHLTLPTKRIV